MNSSTGRVFSGTHFDDANCSSGSKVQCEKRPVVAGDGGGIELQFGPSNRKQPNSHQNVYRTAPAGSQQINRNEMH